MKKSAAIFFLVILCISVAGFYPAFRVMKWRARQEIKTRIKKSVPEYELHVIDLEANIGEIQWHEKDKEFRLHGKMFDIVRSETKNGHTIYYCIDDKDETRLFAQLNELVNSQINTPQSNKNATAKNLVKAFFQDYIPAEKTALQSPRFSIETHYFYLQNYSSFSREINSPPPEKAA